jgi:integrase
VNPERKALYQLCWHLGASQGDIANLKGEDVDWQNGTVSFVRKKTGVPVIVHLGGEALNVFKDLPAEGVLLPHLSRVRAGDRATEFRSRCRQLGIAGVTLHTYPHVATRENVKAFLSQHPEKLQWFLLGVAVQLKCRIGQFIRKLIPLQPTETPNSPQPPHHRA